MAKEKENQGFTCVRCGTRVLPLTNGSYRNHCPCCLWSVHVDAKRPGDRMGECMGMMKPMGVIKKRKGFQLVHRCTRCSKVQPNKIAIDTLQPDAFEAVLDLMRNGDHRIPKT